MTFVVVVAGDVWRRKREREDMELKRKGKKYDRWFMEKRGDGNGVVL